jgi:hypothetical protein
MSCPGETLKPGAKHAPLPANAGENAIARLDELRNAKGSLRTAEIRRNMQRIMQSDAAVFRTQVGGGGVCMGWGGRVCVWGVCMGVCMGWKGVQREWQPARG